MEDPGIERQAEREQALQAGTELGAAMHARPLGDVAVADHRIVVPGGAEADALEAPAAGGDLGLEHRRHAIAESEVGVADDAGADAGRAVVAAGAHCRHACSELDLADRLHLHRPLRAIHGAAFLEDGRHHLVAGVGVGQEVVEQIAIARHVPEMMMGVDDLELGIEDRLGCRLGEPGRVRLEDAAELGRLRVAREQPAERSVVCHCRFLPSLSSSQFAIGDGGVWPRCDQTLVANAPRLASRWRTSMLPNVGDPQ